MTLEFFVVQAARTALASGGTADDLEKAIQEAFRIKSHSSCAHDISEDDMQSNEDSYFRRCVYDISEDDVQSYEDSYFGGFQNPDLTDLGLSLACEADGRCEDSSFELCPILPEDDFSKADGLHKDDGYEDSHFGGWPSPLSKGDGLRDVDCASGRDYRGFWMGPLDTDDTGSHRWSFWSSGIWQVEAMGCVKNSFLHFLTSEELRVESLSLQRCSSCPPGVDVPLEVDLVAEQNTEEGSGEDSLEGESTVSVLSLSSISVLSLPSVDHVASIFDDEAASIHLTNQPLSLSLQGIADPHEIEQQREIAIDVPDWLSLYEKATLQNGFKMSTALQPSVVKFHGMQGMPFWCFIDAGTPASFSGCCGTKAGVTATPPGSVKSTWAVTKDMHQLNDHMRTRSYIGKGWYPTQADAEQFEACCSELGHRTDIPDAARWYRHIESWTPFERSRW